VIIEFSDFQCPFCAKFSQETFPALKNQYVDKALVKFAFRHLPLTRIHPRAWQAAEAAECGARQSKFWTMHDQLFANPSRLEETDLRTYARSSGLDLRLFNSCLAGEARDRVTWDSQSAQTLKISGTPSFLIGVLQSDGRVKVQHVLSGAAPLAEFAKALDPLLKQARLANR
jgi:protein-disulfide isomerase